MLLLNLGMTYFIYISCFIITYYSRGYLKIISIKEFWYYVIGVKDKILHFGLIRTTNKSNKLVVAQ